MKMLPKPVKICCCSASAWTSVVGGFQIIQSVTVIGLAVTALVMLKKNNDGAGSEAYIAQTATVAYGVVFGVEVVCLLLGIILLYGNKKGKVTFLVIWLVVTIIMGIAMVAKVIMVAVTAQVFDKSTASAALVIAFAIYIVVRRVGDVKQQSKNTATN